MPAAPRRSPTASRARMRSGSRSCSPTAACCNNLNKLKKDNTGYDLQEPVHRRRRHARHHHRGGAAAGAAAALGRDGVRRRALAGGRARPARPRDRAHRRRRHQLRADAARSGIELVLKHGAGCRDPLPSKHPWYVLIELSSQARDGPARRRWRRSWPRASSAASSTTPPSPRASSRPRRSGASAKCSARCSGHEGGSIKHDISVPVAAVPAFIERGQRRGRSKLIPGARPLPFGHLGDGNIHYNVTPAGRRRQGRVPQALGRGERRGVRRSC